MAYTFDPIFATDPNNAANVAANAAITLFDPADSGMAPITIVDVTGASLPNPITVNKNGFGPAFVAEIERVGWHGAGFTGYFTSYEGLKLVATDAQAAAEAAASNAGAAAEADLAARVAAGEFTGAPGQNGTNGQDGSNVLPTDTAIKDAITTPGTQTATALSATILDQVAGPIANATGGPIPTLTWEASQPATTTVLHSLATTSPVTYIHGDPVFYQNGIVSTLPGGPLGVSLTLYGTELAFQLYLESTTPAFKVEANGHLVTARAGDVPPSPVTGTTVWAKLTFPTAGPHKITGLPRQVRWRGIAYPAASGIAPNPQPATKRIVVGPADSFVGGSGEVGGINTFAVTLGSLLGTGKTMLSGQGGSGFTVAGNGTVFTDTAVRLAPIVAAKPTDIVIEGGRNDTGATYATLKAAAKSVFTYLATNAPTARLHVLLPVAGTDGTEQAAAWASTNAAIADAAAESTRIYSVINPTAEGWFTTANRPTFVLTDNIHLNQQGHDYMAARVAGKLLPAIQDGATAMPVVTVYAGDTFSRADGAMGSTESGALAWSIIGASGVGTIESGTLKIVAGGAGWDGSQAVVDTAQATVSVEAKNVGTGNIAGICARMSADGTQGFVFAAASSSWVLRRRDAYNTWVTLQTVAVTPAAGQVAKMTLNGSTINCYLDGVLVTTATDAAFATNTRHGVYAVASTKYFDNYKVTSIPA